MSRHLLSAALIVKNEEEKLPACLEALQGLKPLLGEVCVYDTGSTDRTVDIARSYGARVELGYWDVDFARARNAATTMTSGEWVLTIDADEVLEYDYREFEGHIRMLTALGAERAQAVGVAVLDVREGRERQAHVVPRFFRPEVAHWVGRIHEQVEAFSGAPLKASDPGREVIAVVHSGYDAGDRLQQKRKRNGEIAQAVIDEARAAGDVDSVRLVRGLVDHARSVRDLGEWEGAHKDLVEVRSLGADLGYRAFGLEILADMLTDAGRLEESEEVIGELQVGGIGNSDYHRWLRVRLLMARRDFPAALRELRSLDVLMNSLGVLAKPELLIDARFKAALACQEYLEAASCLMSLMGTHGIFEPGRMSLFLKLTYELGTGDIARLLWEVGGSHRGRVISELSAAGSRGPDVAERLRELSHTGAAFGAAAGR